MFIHLTEVGSFFSKIKMSRSCNIQSVRSPAASLFIQYSVCHEGRILLKSLLNLVRFRLLPSWQGMIFGASCYKWQRTSCCVLKVYTISRNCILFHRSCFMSIFTRSLLDFIKLCLPTFNLPYLFSIQKQI